MHTIADAASEAFVPDFDDPYIGLEGDITDFEYDSDLVILRMREACAIGTDREADYIVAAPYKITFRIDGEPHEITVPAGMLTDLVSVPRPLRWAIERVGPHLEAAIVHDFLFIAWTYAESESDRVPTREKWVFANRVMIAGLQAAGVSALKCWAIAWALSTPFSWAIFAHTETPNFIDLDKARLRTAGLRAGNDTDYETA